MDREKWKKKKEKEGERRENDDDDDNEMRMLMMMETMKKDEREPLRFKRLQSLFFLKISLELIVTY